MAHLLVLESQLLVKKATERAFYRVLCKYLAKKHTKTFAILAAVVTISAIF
ncbi:hypothetical protein RED65_13542 [Oceanobacter sp. RED65]|uniref:Uncharacterized protein n=1 Tax=Bermanella marisrubri TaxID=207949 RepID=Q1N380_9GAMM|nr:hypothetical protein RED65_13542 [Oceanobacter sp. RED65] [Bermanella marisrubri]